MKKSLHLLKSSFIAVCILLFIIAMSWQRCSYNGAKYTEAITTVSKQSDSLKQAKKDVDSVATQTKQIQDVAEAVARTNEVLKDSITTIQAAADVQQVKTDVIENGDAAHLKTDVDMLAEQRDSLVELNKELLAKADSIRARIAVITKTDTVLQPAKPTYVSSYLIGQRQSADAKPPRFALNLGLTAGHYWATNTNTFGLALVTTFGHLRLFNGVYYTDGVNRIRSNTNLNLDIGSINFKKKRK